MPKIHCLASRRSKSRQRLTRVLSSIAAFAALTVAGLAKTAEIRLLSAASIQEVFKEIIGDFERASGHKIIIHYGTMGAITEWMRAGEEADLVISSRQSIASLVKEGKIEPSSQVTISKVGVGMVVASGNTPPPIANAEDFGRALLAAKVVVYADP